MFLHIFSGESGKITNLNANIMKTINIKKAHFKNKEFEKAINLLLDNNFKVIVYPKDLDLKSGLGWAHFIEGDKIGYIQCGDFGHGVKISTCHKPNKITGTGYGVWEEPKDEFTIDELREAFINAPHWAKVNEVETVVKYKDWDEYLSLPVNQILDKAEIVKTYGIDWSNLDMNDSHERELHILDPYDIETLLLEISCNIPAHKISAETITKQFNDQLEAKISSCKEIFEANLQNITKEAQRAAKDI